MKITSLQMTGILSEKELKEQKKLQDLIAAINEREIPEETARKITEKVVFLNGLKGPEKDRIKKLVKEKQAIITLLEKELGLVPKDHYASLWMMLGISVFGLPFGAALGAFSENMALLAVGMPIGIALGYAFGAYLDHKAASEHRVLNVKMN